MKRAASVRVAHPLFQTEAGGSTPTAALLARDLTFGRCTKELAAKLTRLWHSRLPNVQRGPWQYAFSAEHDGIVYAVALWLNPSTRSLPSHWLELRRLAASPDSPKNTCSRFLGYMVRYFKQTCPERERCISYQDTAVHEGTIYKAAGWVPCHTGGERQRDRLITHKGTSRLYRSSINGTGPDVSKKVRWEKVLTSAVDGG